MPTHLLSSQPPEREQNANAHAAQPDHKPLQGGARTALWIIISVLVVAWVGVSGIGGPYFGKISEVSTNDQSTFLPESAESTTAGDWAKKYTDTEAIPAIIVLQRTGGTQPADATALENVAQQAENDKLLASDASPAIPADDGEALQIVMPLSTANVDADVEKLSSLLNDQVAELPNADQVTSHITGPAGFTADLSAAFAGIDGILLLVALVAVFIILIIVYRSPLLPIIVLLTSIVALSASILVVWHLADADILLINGQVQGILFILVVGATTDYSLLFVARFRDELGRHVNARQAGLQAVRGVLEPIAASGSTVIAGLLCLLLSDLASTKALGPVAAVGIVMAMLAALTFLPAALMLIGRAGFWPFIPQPHAPDAATRGRASAGSGQPNARGGAESDQPRTGVAAVPGQPSAESDQPRGRVTAVPGQPRVVHISGSGLWVRIARLVASHPRIIWVGLVIVLALPLAALGQFKASGVPQSEFVLGQSEARAGQTLLAKHFPAGTGTPTTVIIATADQQPAAQAIAALPGVESLAVRSADSPSGTIPLDTSGQLQQAGPPTGAAARDTSGQLRQAGPPTGASAGAPQPTQVEGRVLLEVTLSDPADSLAAEDTVVQIREAVHKVNAEALVGGETAVDLDTNTTAEADRALVIPLILLVITVILILLLRSLLAPLLLVALTVLSFATALSVSGLVFNHVLSFPGADPSVPLYAFVFLVALGIDYNIFLMSRVREDAVQLGTRRGVLSGLIATGGVITSAGIVLAATFAALAVLPIMFLVQLAFIVTFGVLLDAILVRSLVVPALVFDAGRAVWWPWHKRM